MNDVPTLYVRNVPAKLVANLKRRAEEHGRSLNAEIVEVLEASVEDELRRKGLAKRLEQLRAKYVLPPGVPDAVDLIRQGREERAREIERRARGT